VAQTLFADQALARDYKLGPVVTVVDAADAEGRRSSAEIARAQIAAADVVVLSKADRTRGLDGVQREIHELNPSVRCIPAAFGEVDPAVLLEAQTGNDKAFPAAAAHAGGIETFVLRFERPVPRALLERFIATLVGLRGADLLRVKGTVPLESGEHVLVQGVRHVFDRLRPVARGEPALVFITKQVGRNEIEALWHAMAGLVRE
jgi:G3E family GTPase